MRYTKTDTTYILNFEQGDEIITTLTQFCTEHDIANAFFSGIGAAKGLSCGYYALDEKKYYFTQYDDLVEVVSLSGNVALREGKPFVHVHGVFTGTDNMAFGGHIEKMTAGIVVEVMLTPLSTKTERKHNEKIGLFLLQCNDEFYRPISE